MCTKIYNLCESVSSSGKVIARDQAARDQRADRKKPEPQPGTQRQREDQRHFGFAAGAGAGSGVSETPEGVDSMGVIHHQREQERVTEALASIATPDQLGEVLSQPSGNPASAVDRFIPSIAGSVGVAPMPGWNPGMAVPALGNPAVAATAA
ncbi:MAG: hypothetical protein Q8Q56_00790, partial [Alphaproteobacteria bacterium]|nr:hypothetical protein [Alphaproteobacteria bacterium]